MNWLNTFLKDRQTCVGKTPHQSTWKPQNIGLPQGSSLSPILYIIYTLDYQMTPLGKKYLDIGCFADDTVFYNKQCTRKLAKEYLTPILQLEY